MGQNATFIKLKIGVKEFVGETSNSLSSSVDVIDVSSKASGRVRRILPGRVAENISFESLADDTNSTDYGYADAHAAAKNGTLITWTIVRGAVTLKTGSGLLNQPLLSSKTGLRDKVILELLFSTGLRVSELVSLNRDQINLKTREFGVIGKGGRRRVVFISKKSADYLHQYLSSRSDNHKPLFIRMSRGNDITTDGEKMRLTARSVQRLVKSYVAKAKLPIEATPHTLRHSMATDLLRSGADLRSVQEILGHKNIATTQIYTHVTDARLREVHEKFHSGNK